LPFLLVTVSKTLPAIAQDKGSIRIASDVHYEFIGRWDVDKPNKVLTDDAPKYFGVTVKYTAAKNAMKLYRVTYSSVVPERGIKPIVATDLVAVPDIAGTSFPMVSYKHGAVYEKTQVPPVPDQSPETQLCSRSSQGRATSSSFENYYGVPGLARSPLADAYYDVARKAYLREPFKSAMFQRIYVN
jgi:hypothetical protein